MKYLRERALRRELLAGTWLNLGSTVSAEMVGRAGFDWALIDQEHGAGGDETILPQLIALEAGPTVGIVRVAWHEPWRFKRALDLGAGGVMVPYVETADAARQVVSAMRYPPRGARGAARFIRATGFGADFDRYYAEADDNLLTVVQIETAAAVENAEAIAAVDGVDVLFVGPLDLSVSLGIRGQSQHPDFRAAITRVVRAARDAGKAAGTVIPTLAQLDGAIDDGYTFLAVGSDGALVGNGMREIAGAFGTRR